MTDRRTPPPVKPFEFRALPPEEVTQLDNGMTVHLYNGGDQPVSSMSLLFPGGTCDCANPVVPQLFAALAAEGSRHYSGEQIADILDFNGTRFNGKCHQHYTGFEMITLNGRVDAVLPMISDIVCCQTFDERAVENARLQMKSRLLTDMAKVSYLADKGLSEILCGKNHPAAFSPTPAGIDATDGSELSEFHKRHNSTQGAHAFIAGKLDDSLRAHYLDFLENLRLDGAGIVQDFRAFTPESVTEVTENLSGSLQSAIAMGIPTIERTHPDYIPLRLTVMALGGYFGSRLMANVREEKGYTYGIYAYLAGSREGSSIHISAQCDNRYTRAVTDEIYAEVRRMRDNPPQGQELERLKFHAASSLAEVLDSPLSIMNYHSTALIVDMPDGYFEAQQRAIASLTPDIIAEMTGRYLMGETMRSVIVGDISKM